MQSLFIGYQLVLDGVLIVTAGDGKEAVLAPHSCTAKIDNIAYFPNLQQQDSIPGKDWQRVNFWIRRYGCCYPF